MSKKQKKLERFADRLITATQNVFLENPENKMTEDEFVTVFTCAFAAMVANMDDCFESEGALTVKCVDSLMNMLYNVNGFRCTPCVMRCDKAILKSNVSQDE